jgi:hypothetical protein
VLRLNDSGQRHVMDVDWIHDQDRRCRQNDHSIVGNVAESAHMIADFNRNANHPLFTAKQRSGRNHIRSGK